MVFKEIILSVEECHTLVKRYLRSDEFQVLKYEEEPSEDFENYFKIKIKTLNGVQSDLSFIGKKLEKNAEKIFSHEVLYMDCNFIPKYCYGQEDKFIIFEDFTKENFIRPQEMDIEHIKLTLKNLAGLHAKSVEFEMKKSKKQGKSYKIIDENDQFINDPLMESLWFQEGLNNLNLLIDLLPENHLDSNRIKTKIADIFYKFQNRNSGFKQVLCHGSLWNKNILFKYNNNKKPTDCKFINFEYQHYNSPVVDVLQFIYMNTNQESRKKHLHELLEFYYECLKNQLESMDLKPGKIIPKNEDYDVAIHYFLPLIKLQMACLQHNKYSEKSISNSSKRFIKEFETNEYLRKALTESIMELKHLVTHPGITLEDCFKIIKNKIETTDYQLIDYKITPLGKISGYLGDHNKLKIEIIVNNEKRVLNLFAKFIPRGQTAVSIEQDTDAFYKEMFFYQQFIPLIKNYRIELINECATPCYFARYKDVMVFDDLEIQNFISLEPRKPISFEFAKMIIRKLAKFHASSIILEEKLGEVTNTKYSLINDFAKELQESLATEKENHQGGQCMKTGINAVEHMMELFPDPNNNPSVSKEEMRIKIKKAFEVFYEAVKPSKRFRNAICHGDLWISNTLIQCFDGKPTDCRFVDFQMCRYCPPVQDLLTFIYLTTNRRLRKEHFSDLIELYYKELSRNIEDYGYDIKNIYPYKEFMKSIEYTIPQAVCQTTCFFQLCLINPDILKEYMTNEESARNVLVGDRRDFISDMYKRDPLFRERAGECIQDLREMCIKYF
ncbi:hypothetical protein ILUMI_26317 [Ignelater luminosus]|uniref:CHK kinase-like domain-containing protein n=1 Tax=Ignelater luminosus TaxID=2038154 RepID=A0A8K0C3W1_IGNLU|nr:hypothetical protein ILUMI_26317 [Ignelater luminosus]